MTSNLNRATLQSLLNLILCLGFSYTVSTDFIEALYD